jgi:DNA repair exonuclease SbcCD nuclease subunit
MKIAVISDLHLGFGYNTEIENDPFFNLEEALEKAKDADLILIPGDIFDSKNPKTSTFIKTLKILSDFVVKNRNNGVKLIESSKELHEISKRIIESKPILAISGNHERRARDETNPVEALEAAGLLIYGTKDRFVFEKDGEKICIYTFSNVPERFAYEELKEFNPKPLPNCFNILMLHQNIDPYVYSPIEASSLNVNNLPFGFDLIVDGHVHKPFLERVKGSILLIAGSITLTQFSKEEAETEKGIHLIDTLSKEIEFIPLEKRRRFFYDEIKIKSDLSFKEQIKNVVESYLTQEFFLKPILRLKIVGKDVDIIDKDLKELEMKYKEKAILILVKQLVEKETGETVFLRNLIDQKKSLEEIAFSTLKKNLDLLGFKLDFDYERLFRLLEEDVEKTFEILMGSQKTLEWWHK